VAAQRAAARRADVRNRVLLAGGSVVAVLAIVLAFVFIRLGNKPSGGGSAGNSTTGTAQPASVLSNITGVPASTLNSVGKGATSANAVQTVTHGGAALTSGGKPEIVYVGAEYCPYCAAERWAMVVALSRFGTFSGLHFIHSSGTDAYPNTPTLTFYKSSYTSKYVTFSPVEWYSDVPSGGGGYTTLQTPTSAQMAIFNQYDAPPYVSSANKGSFPFVDIGNKYVITGASYSPQTLAGKTWAQVAAALKDPSSPIAQAIDGTANQITAAICKATNGSPASVCNAAGVKAARGSI
jgi:thiol-disulfide isomerase/thioredoxin